MEKIISVDGKIPLVGGKAIIADVSIGDIPDYVRTEASRVVNDVVGVQTPKTINIGVMSDFHTYSHEISSSLASHNWTAAKHAIQGMYLIGKKMHLDIVAYMGDMVTGDTFKTAAGWLADMQTMNEYFADIRTDNLLMTYGNHDMGYGGTMWIPPVNSYPYIAAHNSKMVLGNTLRGYGYQDLENYKLRIIMLNTCEYDSAVDSGLKVTAAQYAFFANALDLSGKANPNEWQTLIFSHFPLDWSGSTFPTILSAYENGSTVTVNGNVVNYSGKNSAKIIGNVHGHLHNLLKGTIAGTSVHRWCVPNTSYDYSNTYVGWQEPTTYNKTADTANDTSLLVLTINLDDQTLNRIHYGAGYSDNTNYGSTPTPSYTNQVPISTDNNGQIYNGTGYKDGYRLNSSGVETATAGKSVTGFMPFVVGDRLYTDGIGWNNTAASSNYIAFYNASKECIQSVSEANYRTNHTLTAEGNINGDVLATGWGVDLSATAYIRISGVSSGADYIATRNEVIE